MKIPFSPQPQPQHWDPKVYPSVNGGEWYQEYRLDTPVEGPFGEPVGTDYEAFWEPARTPGAWWEVTCEGGVWYWVLSSPQECVWEPTVWCDVSPSQTCREFQTQCQTGGK